MTGLRLLLALAAGFLGACAEVERQPEPSPPEAVAAPEPVAAAEQRMESQPLKYLVGRRLSPQPTRPLNVKSKCSHRDAVGTQTNLNLLVRNAEVKTFAAKVSIPKRGTCRFDLKDFNQAEKLPQALLKARDGSDCLVRLWEQGNRVTIAFNSCPRSCDGEAFSYLWPIMVEAKSGRCF